jgi:hypothetical protein
MALLWVFLLALFATPQKNKKKRSPGNHAETVALADLGSEKNNKERKAGTIH